MIPLFTLPSLCLIPYVPCLQAQIFCYAALLEIMLQFSGLLQTSLCHPLIGTLEDEVSNHMDVGDEVGASFIDRDVEGLILERLKSLNDRDIGDNTNRELLAYGMAMGSSFQAKKRLLGRSDDDTFQIPIPNIGRNSAADFPWLRGNKMIFNWLVLLWTTTT